MRIVRLSEKRAFINALGMHSQAVYKHTGNQIPAEPSFWRQRRPSVLVRHPPLLFFFEVKSAKLRSFAGFCDANQNGIAISPIVALGMRIPCWKNIYSMKVKYSY